MYLAHPVRVCGLVPSNQHDEMLTGFWRLPESGEPTVSVVLVRIRERRDADDGDAGHATAVAKARACMDAYWSPM